MSEAIAARRLLRLEYYKEYEDEFSERVVEPYALINGREGWYVASFDPAQGRRAPLPPGPHQERRGDRRDASSARPEVDPAADVDGWPRTGEVEASRTRARLGLPRARALGARGAPRRRGARRTARSSSSCRYKGADWLVREILKEAGDAVVLEPADARDAVRAAVERLRAGTTAG